MKQRNEEPNQIANGGNVNHLVSIEDETPTGTQSTPCPDITDPSRHAVIAESSNDGHLTNSSKVETPTSNNMINKLLRSFRNKVTGKKKSDMFKSSTTNFLSLASARKVAVDTDLLSSTNDLIGSEANEPVGRLPVNDDLAHCSSNSPCTNASSSQLNDQSNDECLVVPSQEPLMSTDLDTAEILPENGPSNGSLTQELAKLSKCGWYWGPISRSDAEEKLLGHQDGSFLVRDSSDDRYFLSLSFKSNGRSFHTRIEYSNGLFSFYSQPEAEGESSVINLIEDSVKMSNGGVFCYSTGRSPTSPSFPVRLTKPLSRFTGQVRSLQYLCRFVIRQNVRIDHIETLPLPVRIKGYLIEGHY